MKTYKNTTLGATMDIEGKQIFFWKGLFSQWYKSPIYDPDLGIGAVCAEQLMMAWKAKTFEDMDAMNAILATDNARKQKDIGRTVKNYDDKIWSAKRLDIVSRINYHKFSQSPSLMDAIVMTDGWTLCEASPEDCLWGVGLSEDDPLILDPANWNGLNLLGEALMNARNKIINELL